MYNIIPSFPTIYFGLDITTSCTAFRGFARVLSNFHVFTSSWRAGLS